MKKYGFVITFILTLTLCQAGIGTNDAFAVDLPGKPTNLTATAGDNRLTLSWDALTDVGSGITDYEWRAELNNSGFWSVWSSLGETTTTQRFLAANGTTYTFQIRAVSDDGAGPASNSATATPQRPLLPGKPTNLLATPKNTATILSWTAPTRTGTGIIDYEYRFDEDGDNIYSDWRSLKTTTTCVRFSGLTNGTTYKFQVRAVDDDGAGPASDIASVTPQIVAPSEPTFATATATYTVVKLTWNKPLYDGGSPVTEYEYQYQKSGGTWSEWESTGTAKSKTLTELEHGTTYNFNVRAINDVGEGDVAAISTTTTAYTKPGKPREIEAVAGNHLVFLYWKAPISDGGRPITTYQYRYRQQDKNGTWGKWSEWADANDSDIYTAEVIEDLTNGINYGFQVRAKNAIGPGPKSSTATAMPTPRIPYHPGRPTATPGTAPGSVHLTWSKPYSDGGSPITEYEYRYRMYENGVFGEWTEWTSTGSANRSHTLTGLEIGKRYRLKMRARNSVGPGYQSYSVQFTVQ